MIHIDHLIRLHRVLFLFFCHHIGEILIVSQQHYDSFPSVLVSPKGAKACSASGRKSSKRVPVEDMGNNIDAPYPACCKRRLGGAWRVVHYK